MTDRRSQTRPAVRGRKPSQALQAVAGSGRVKVGRVNRSLNRSGDTLGGRIRPAGGETYPFGHGRRGFGVRTEDMMTFPIG